MIAHGVGAARPHVRVTAQLARRASRWLRHVALGGLVALAAFAAASSGASAGVPAVTGVTVFPRFSGDLAFSPDGSKLEYYQTDSSGTFQLMTANANGTRSRCITCTHVSGGPPVDADKDGGTWSSRGWIATTVLEHRAWDWSFRHSSMGYYMLMNGIGSSMWLTTSNGAHWYKVRSLGADGNLGVLPEMAFTPDGRKIVWSECVGAANATYSAGTWKMYTADVTVGANRVPSLSHITNITPRARGLYEPGSFTPDGQNVIYTSNATPPAPATNEAQIYEENLTNRRVTRLTNNRVWNEHAHITPNGLSFAYLRSGEIWLGSLAGGASGGEPLTHFNQMPAVEPWHKGDAGDWPVIPVTHVWSPDGRRLSLTIESIADYPTSWAVIVTFNHAVGRSNPRGHSSHTSVSHVRPASSPTVGWPPSSRPAPPLPSPPTDPFR